MTQPGTKRRLLSALLVAALSSGTAFAVDPMALRYYEDAVARFNQNDVKGAEIQLRNALAHDPTQLPARILMGELQLRLGNPLAAEEALVMANQLGADPISTALPLAQARNRSGKHDQNLEDLVPIGFPAHLQPDLWVELGIARMQGEDLDGAEIAFREAQSLEPLHQGAAIGLARIRILKGDLPAAEQLATNAVQQFPDNAKAWLLKATVLHSQGKAGEAVDYYSRARDLDPNDSGAALGEATAMLDSQQYSRAAALFQELRSAYPWMAEAAFLHATALEKLGQKAEAESARNAASEILAPLSPSDLVENLALLRLAGEVAYENQRFERAFQSMKLYVERRPEDLEARKTLARIAMEIDRPEDAKRTLAPILNTNQVDAETIAILGDANAQLGDYLAAESFYREAIRNYRGGPALIGRLGAIQSAQGQKEDALSTLQAFIDSTGANPPSRLSLFTAMLHFSQGDLEAADTITSRVVQRQPDNLTALNLQASLDIARGNFDSAETRLRAIIEKNPAYRPAGYNLAKLYAVTGRYDDAEQALNRFLTEDPSDVQALLDAARLARRTGDIDRAVELYKTILEIDAQQAVPTIELVDIYLTNGRRSDAIKLARGLRDARPNLVESHQTLARTLIANGELEDAQSTLRKAASLAGVDPRRLTSTAHLQKTIGAYDDAENNYNKLLLQNPNALGARFGLAEVLLLKGEVAQAINELRLILDRAPDNGWTLALLGDAYMANGQYVEATDAYTQASQHIDRPELVVSQFRARMLAGDVERALADLKEKDAADPGSEAIIRALAESSQQLGRTQDALHYYERLIQLRPQDAIAYNNLANLFEGIDSEQAFKAARRAYELAPKNPAVLDTYGWALTGIGELEKGLSLLRNAVARDGSSALIRYHLGVALQEYGSQSEARRQLEKAIMLGQGAGWAGDAERRLKQLN